ncbi:MAG: hypothetical protein K0R67_833 [Paenibacillus sp.]|nr:hypothetical protein [Paenibacillus sp.]
MRIDPVRNTLEYTECKINTLHAVETEHHPVFV